MIRIIAVGKKHDKTLQAAIDEYQKRLKGQFKVEWLLIPHSPHEGAQAIYEESERIYERLDVKDSVILLDKRGDQLTSPTLAGWLEARFNRGYSRLVFVIGGAYGVDDRVRSRADLVWALSPLVFPHQLVRLILIEQLYRAQTIIRGEPYHHE